MHYSGNAGSSVAEQTFRVTNCRAYNKVLIKRGSATFVLDDETVAPSDILILPT